MKLFSEDSIMGRIGSKLTELMMLNIMFCITVIPVFTFGAACSALHYELLKIYRGENGKIVEEYLRAFKNNFKRGTAIWLLHLVWLFAMVIAGLLFLDGSTGDSAVPIFVAGAVLYIWAMSLSWACIFNSRYDIPVIASIRNGMVAIFKHPIASVSMLVMAALSVVVFIVPQIAPLGLLISISLCAMPGTVLYSRVFDELEGKDKDGEDREE